MATPPMQRVLVKMEYIYSLILTSILVTNGFAIKEISFPDSFRFGVSSSAHQIEGAWNSHGKSENIWDRLTHTRPEVIKDGSNADVACNSYNLYRRDIEMVAELGVNFYRFSIAWGRILPSGYINETNPEGIQYYNNLIDGLLARNITPMVTIYHWDHPQSLEEIGGFTNPHFIDYYMDYAELLFQLYGDRVKEWISFNEPSHTCSGYASERLNAPMKQGTGIGDYLCGHNLLKAHAKVYHLYHEVYRPTQKGKLVITLDTPWFEPGSTAPEDVLAAEKSLQFLMGWFAHPIYSKEGDYPPMMREIVDRNSAQQGFKRSRLPYFTKEEIDYIKGTSDYFSLNHYSTFYAHEKRTGTQLQAPSHEHDFAKAWDVPEWFSEKGIPGFWSIPMGMRKLLNWVKNQYHNPSVVITENGYPSNSKFSDEKKIEYISTYLEAVWGAINEDDCNVQGYSVWSLMDSYEWKGGYTMNFGLYHVDFNSEHKTRTMRGSGMFYKQLVDTHILPSVNYTAPSEILQLKLSNSSTSVPSSFTQIVMLSVVYLCMFSNSNKLFEH